jgi:hypothetical protein
MKTVKSFLVLFVALVSFSAFAADVRVFGKMSGESFPVFKQSLEKQGLLQEEKGVQFFDTKELAKAACAFGEENQAALYQKYGTNEKCQGIFLARNGLGAIMTLDDFRAQGQGAGFWLADISAGSAAVATPKTVASEQKPAVSVPEESRALKALTAGLATLKKRFDSLYEDGDEPMTKKGVEAILGTQAKEAIERDKKINARIDELSKKQDVLEGRTNEVVAKANTTAERVTGIENKPIIRWGTEILLGVLLSMAFMLCMMAYAVYRKAKAPAPQRGSVPHAVSANEAHVRKAA